MNDFHGLQCYGLHFDVYMRKPLPLANYYSDGHWIYHFLEQALIAGECIYTTPQCSECALREHCAYPQLFKSLSGFVLHDWQMSPNRQHFWFRLIFMGQTVRYAEDWIKNIAISLKKGTLKYVRDISNNKIVFKNGHFKPRANLVPLKLYPLHKPYILIRILTPLLHKETSFWNTLHSRLQELINEYGNGDTLFSSISPWHIHKIHLQNSEHLGQLGFIELRDVTVEGAQCLAIGEYLHAGTQTELGYGRFSVTEMKQYEKRFVNSRWG